MVQFFHAVTTPSLLEGFSNYSLFHCIFHISGNKVLVGPLALGLKENATAYLFWKNTNFTVQISSGSTGLRGLGGDLGDWGTGFPSSLQDIFSIWPNSTGIVGIVRVLYMEDWRSNTKSKYIALTSIYVRWEKCRRGMGVRFWVSF